MKRFLSIVVVLLLTGPATAATKEGNFTVLSLGNQSCGKVVEAYQKNAWDKLSFSIWVGGYLTAVNEHDYPGSNIAKNTDSAARDLWLYNYCQENPLHKLGRAASALYRELSAK